MWAGSDINRDAAALLEVQHHLGICPIAYITIRQNTCIYIYIPLDKQDI